MHVMSLLAQATHASMDDVKSGYNGLIFTGLFFVGLLIVGIWWMKRQA
jgi:hypothetical protein